MQRFAVAMMLYAALAFAAWQTLTGTIDLDGRKVPVVWPVWAILAMFAVRTWTHEKRRTLEERDQRSKG